MNPNLEYLREALIRARQDSGLTQKALAEKLGTNQAYISSYETGKPDRQNMTIRYATRWAEACGHTLKLEVTKA